MNIQIVKVSENAVVPTKAHPSDVGYDLTCISECKKINSCTTLYETGIQVRPPNGYYFEIHPRSSIIKLGYILANNTGIIDPHYRGTLKVALSKIDCLSPDLETPFCCCQLILRKVECTDSQFDLVEKLNETDRGEGGFGSSNK